MPTQTQEAQNLDLGGNSQKTKSLKNPKKKVVVVGMGYVGLPLALLADHRKCDVTGIDIDPERVERINSKKLPFTDKKIRLSLEESGIKATTNWTAIETADVIVICVPTILEENRSKNFAPLA